MIFSYSGSSAQEITKESSKIFPSISFEIQAYPAGFIPGIAYEQTFASKHGVHLRLGGNFANRRDWGKHDDEVGSGFGATLGYRYYFEMWKQQFSVGARADYWKMSIDWKTFDLPFRPIIGSGNTKIDVFQPTFEIAWWLNSKDNKGALGISLTNGFEINVKTEGEPVGEGFITLLGFQYRYHLGTKDKSSKNLKRTITPSF